MPVISRFRGIVIFSKGALKMVEEWRRLHRAALLENWRLARERRPLKQITPLE